MKKMKQCKKCSKEIATNAKVCPGCGAENKKSGKAVLCLWAIVFILAVGTTGCSDVDNSKEVNSGNVEAAQEVSQDNGENAIAENELEVLCLGAIIFILAVGKAAQEVSQDNGEK